MENNNELRHHGVLGMKWGVRRYQNYDGTRIGKLEKKRDKLRKHADKYVTKTEKGIIKRDDPSSKYVNKEFKKYFDKHMDVIKRHNSLISVIDKRISEIEKTTNRLDGMFENADKQAPTIAKEEAERIGVKPSTVKSTTHLYTDFIDDGVIRNFYEATTEDGKSFNFVVSFTTNDREINSYSGNREIIDSEFLQKINREGRYKK